ncbi:MAG: hypothetical protein KR126chlam1_00894 [Chlamydiae bacterium]|nr:hypothetical protein [Chlamydiota bacterium]
MRNRFKFFLLLFSGFLDYVGIGLVFPLFAALFFDRSSLLLAPETSDLVRGIWMGVLIALTPLVQFFVSPILGSLSESSILGVACRKARGDADLFGKSYDASRRERICAERLEEQALSSPRRGQ